MAKLFSLEEFEEVENKVGEPDKDSISSIALDIEEYSSDLNIATERFKTVSSDLNLITDISSSLKNKKLASVDYFTSMENYRPVITSIADNLGIKSRIPSLEDFKNPYGTEASHQIAMEGFFDYIKKIWEKIKEIFVAFFKKINTFLRRLIKADLDLEVYEEYLEGMVAKLKSSKAKITDSKIQIDTKLPSLLANEGMETVNSDFILTVGENKLKHLVSVTNTVFNQELSKLSKKEFKELHDKVQKLIDKGFNKDKTLDEIQDKLDKIKNFGIDSLKQLFSHQVNDIRDLPEKVYDAIYYHFDKDDLDTLKTFSLINSNNFNENLPKNFNSYYIVSDSGKVFISANTETNTYTQNKLTPISNVSNLVTFYEFYKKFSKQINLKQIDSIIDDFQNSIDDIIKLMKGKYVDLLEKIEKANKKKNRVERIRDLGDAFEALMEYADSNTKEVVNDPVEFQKKLNDIIASKVTMTDDMIVEMMNIINNPNMESTEKFIAGINDKEQFITEVTELVGGAIYPDSNISEEELKEIKKEYEELQKFLTNYLNSLQVTIKEVSINLAGTYTELRYELVKYIYNSARLYTT